MCSRSTLWDRVRNSAHPDEQLGHDHVPQLTGGVQGRAGQRGGPGQAAVDLLLGAVGQEQQQSGQIPVGHRTQEPRGHALPWELGPRGRLEGRHELPLFVLGPDPRLPFLPGKETQAGARQNLRSSAGSGSSAGSDNHHTLQNLCQLLEPEPVGPSDVLALSL